MPEGDTVRQLSRRLQGLCGRRVLHSSFRVPSLATVDLSGTTLSAIWPYGKHLFMQCDDVIIHTHLKMEGSWQLLIPGQRWRKPAHQARVVVRVDAGPGFPHPTEIVGYQLGFVRLVSAVDYPRVIEHLGPDVLGDNWDGDEAIRRILARPERTIGAALLDQRNLAGVGNEYRAEICFLCGYHPARPVAECNVARVIDTTRRVMWFNKDRPVRVFTGDARRGHTTYVFGRRGKPCRRCGATIRGGSLGGVDAGGDPNELERIIWWCPRCQPLEPSG